MKTFRLIAPLFAMVLAATAHADTILLGSFATTASNPGFSNSATSYVPAASTVNSGSSATYALNAGTTWHPAIGTSTYVSFDPNTGPTGSYFAPNGDYTYTSSFSLNSLQANIGIGSLTILADDTVAVYLNGILMLAAAGPMGPSNTYITCSNVGPNCLTPTTFGLSGLLVGNNVLTFDVKQVNSFNEGIDYSGSIIAAVPEPASLAFASTGLVALAGVLRRRFRA